LCPKDNAIPEQPFLDNLLQQLLAADDPSEKAAIVAENAIAQLPTPVALVVQRCTILRWFDESIVTALLDEIPPIERPAVVQTMITTLTMLPFIERLAWGWAYHNQTRTGLLTRIPPILLQDAAALALPAYNAHINPSLARVEALYCSVVSAQSDIAIQLLDALLEEAGHRENWQAILTAFHTVDEASALPFSVAIPQTATHHFFRGIAYHELEDLEGAIANYDQAIALEPNNSAAYYNRGNARRDQKDLEGAIADYDQAIALGPDRRLMRTISQTLNDLLVSTRNDSIAQRLPHLTIRETEILRLFALGFTTRRIADELNINYGTVRAHQRSIYRKLQVHSLVEAIYQYENQRNTPVD
jgi:DNA-binding CsgD family transcriptional regulator